MILTDPYANAFNRTPDGNRWDDDLPPQGPWVWERKWELDSLAFPLDLAARLDALGCRSWQTPEFWAALEVILEVAKTEQHHEAKSTYRFTRPDAPASDTLVREGRGPLTRECGLVFQAFRPSDDACQLGFNIPGNAFFASTLGHLAPLLGRNPLKARVLDLASSIEEGIGAHGMIRRPEPHLAYEVNGMGGQLFMDDANLPSLLGLPYLGVMEAGGPLYQATRRRVLSEANPHFVTAPRLIDGEYPQVRNLFPSEATGYAVIGRQEMLDAIKRARLVVEKNSAVRLSFSEGQVILEAGQGDNAQTSEALEATLHGEDIVMAFNPSFLQEGLGATSAPYVRLSFTSASKPAVLTAQPEIDGEDDQEFRLLLMPIRTYGG